MSDEEENDALGPLVSNGWDKETMNKIMAAKAANPTQFASYWEMDEEDVDEATEEQIEKNPQLKLLWAAENNKKDILCSILDSDSSLLNGSDNDGYTALHRAAYEGHVEIMQELLKRGANIHATTNDGWTALHSAANWGQAKAISLLISYNSNVNAVTNGRQTPLHLAAANSPQSKETLELLLMHPHTDFTILNGQNETAAQIAVRCSKYSALFDMCHPSVNILGSPSQPPDK